MKLVRGGVGNLFAGMKSRCVGALYELPEDDFDGCLDIAVRRYSKERSSFNMASYVGVPSYLANCTLRCRSSSTLAGRSSSET